MIEAVSPTDRIRRAYDLRSYFYRPFIAPFGRKPRTVGLELAAIQPRDRVLEVAVGPGSTLLEIARRVGKANVVSGIDLSPRMLAKARRLLDTAGYTNVDLREADARQLPFADGMFDVLYNSYMLDLIPLDDLRVVLHEFERVLKPGGKLVLVNLSKRAGTDFTWWERLYSLLPARWIPYVTGGCRPVLMAELVTEVGFCEAERRFLRRLISSEVITAKKPSIPALAGERAF